MNVGGCVGFVLGCAVACAAFFVLSGNGRRPESAQDPETAVAKKIKDAGPAGDQSGKQALARGGKSEKANPNSDEQGVAVEDSSAAGSPLTESEKQAFGDVSDQIRDAYDQYVQNKDDPSALSRLQHALMAIRPMLFLRAAREMIRFGSADEKKAALQAVGLRFARNNNVALQVSDAGEAARAPETIPDGRDDLGAESLQPGDDPNAVVKFTSEEQRARQSQALVESVANAFSDSDESVRLAAVETAMSLPKEESGILVSRLMSEGDVSLQTTLLEALADSKEPSDLVVSIQALSSENASVVSLAARNLKEATGQDFKTEKSAAEWLEQNGKDLIGSPDVPAAMEK